MAHLSITGTDADGRITKYARFDSEAEATDHAAAHSGTVVQAPAGNVLDYVLTDGALVESARPVYETTFTFDGFRSRLYAGLTEVEIGAIRTAIKDDAEALDWAFDAASDNRIDITSATTAALMDKLLAAGLVTQAHRDNVLDPSWSPA